MSNDSEKTLPGWYIDKRWPGEQRRWDGTRWLDDWRPVAKTSPEALMIVGALLVVLAAVLALVGFTMNSTTGWVVVGVGGLIAGTVFNIGVVSKAVEVGVRAARH